MKIIIKNTAATGKPETILAEGGTERAVDKNVGPNNLRITGEVSAQVAQRLRATSAKVFNRDNQRVTVTFDIWREFSTPLNAEYWLLSHIKNAQREDTLYLHAQGAAGNKIRVTLSDCVLTVVALSHQGVSVFVSYQIVGGAIT